MAHSYHHAASSARIWGGTPADYQAVHDYIDGSKLILADFRHRALRHHAEGCWAAQAVFGVMIINSARPSGAGAADRGTAHRRGPRPHPVLRGLGTSHPARAVDGTSGPDPDRRRITHRAGGADRGATCGHYGGDRIMTGPSHYPVLLIQPRLSAVGCCRAYALFDALPHGRGRPDADARQHHGAANQPGRQIPRPRGLRMRFLSPAAP